MRRLCVRQARSIIFNDDRDAPVPCLPGFARRKPHLRVRPLAGVVEQIARHFLQIAPVPPKPRHRRGDIDGNVASVVELGHDAPQAFEHRAGIRALAHHAGPRRQPRLVEIGRDDPAHIVGFVQHRFGQRRLAAVGFVAQHRQGRFQPMGKIAHLGPRPFDDLGIGSQQFVELFGQRRDLLGIRPLDGRLVALAHRLDRLAQPLDGPQCKARDHAAHGRKDDPHHRQHDDRLPPEGIDPAFHVRIIPRDGDHEPPHVVERDPALDRAQRLPVIVGDQPRTRAPGAERVR